MYSLRWLIANSTRWLRRKSWPRYSRRILRRATRPRQFGVLDRLVADLHASTGRDPGRRALRAHAAAVAQALALRAVDVDADPFAAARVRRLRWAPVSIIASSSLPLTFTVKCGFGLFRIAASEGQRDRVFLPQLQRRVGAVLRPEQADLLGAQVDFEVGLQQEGRADDGIEAGVKVVS
jgi:hypothetical protein